MEIGITRNRVLDLLFILTYAIGYVSLLKYVTYAIFPIPESVALFLFLFVIYIIRFGGKLSSGKVISGRLSFFLVVLYLWELLQGFIVGTESNSLLVAIVNLCSTYVAYKYMSKIIFEKSSINAVLYPYSIYLYYTLLVVFLSSLLILIHILPQYSNQLGVNSLFKTNMESLITFYYFPGCLSVVYNSPSVFLSSLHFPSLSGLSHESQAMYFTIFPALFIQFYLRKNVHNERNILLIFIISTILTTSLTAAICFLLTYCLHLMWKFKDRRQIKSALMIMIFIIVSLFIIVSTQFNSIISAFIQDKANFDSSGSSGSYSLNLLRYILSPSSVLGEGIFSSTENQARQMSLNCGFISSLMIIAFYFLLIYTSIKNIFSKKILCHAIGLGSFYFIAHSFKFGIQVFNNNYIFFIVFLLTYAEKYRLLSHSKLE